MVLWLVAVTTDDDMSLSGIDASRVLLSGNTWLPCTRSGSSMGQAEESH